MAHFAELDENNRVLRVIVIDNAHEDDGENWCNALLGGTWKQTSYNTRGGEHLLDGTPFRKNYAGIGAVYDSDRDAFMAPEPEEDGWVLNEETCYWEKQEE